MLTITESLCLVGVITFLVITCAFCVIGEFHANITQKESSFLIDQDNK